MDKTQEFSKVRRILFPVYGNELRMFIPMASMFMIITLCYGLLRSLKDMYFMHFAGCAEVFPFLKTYMVTPFMVGFTILYAQMSKRYGRDTLFKLVIGYFLIVISLCYFIFIPNIEFFKLDSIADDLLGKFPKMKGLWEVIRFWPCTLLYLHGEGWGTFALGVSFWTLANDIVSLAQAKRIYSFFSIGAGVGSIAAGVLLKVIGEDFRSGLGLAVIGAFVVLIINHLFSKDMKNHPELYMQLSSEPKKVKKPKQKLSFGESLKFLAKSKHLALIATLVLCYGASANLFEATFKSQLTKLSKIVGKGVLADIYGDQAIFVGVLGIALAFTSSFFMKRGWKFAASATPIMTFIATTLFFVFLYASDFFSDLLGDSEFGAAKFLKISVLFGLFNVVFIRATKYILFDPTKEQAYIPLDEDSKVRGKAAVDGIGSRLGKSGGAAVLSVILIPLLGSIDNARPFICIFIFIFLFLWIRAVGKLSRLLSKDEEKSGA